MTTKKANPASGALLPVIILLLTACGSAGQPGPATQSQPATASRPSASSSSQAQSVASTAASSAVSKPASASASKPAVASAQKSLKHVTFRLASPQLDASKSNVAVAQIMGYFDQEGLAIEYGTVPQGVGEATQMVASGALDFSNGGPDGVLAAEARGQDLGVVFFYNEVRSSIFSAAAVLPDSPIQDYRDLKGKKVGVLSLDPGPTLLPKAMLREKGLDPDADVSWVPIGVGPQAVTALQRKQVDAIFFWDTAYALMETLGVKFRYLSPSSQVSNIFYSGFFTKRTTLQNNRDEVVGLGRAMAKGTVFFLANPELSVRMLWQKFPETKPQGIDEATALKSQLHIIESRADKLQTQGKWGSYTQQQWENYAHLLNLDVAKINFGRIYTNDLVDDMNKFDAAAIEKQAKEMTTVPTS